MFVCVRVPTHRHPLIRHLKDAVVAAEAKKDSADSDSDAADSALNSELSELETLARLIYDSALLESGYAPQDPKAISTRVQVCVTYQLMCVCVCV